MTKFNDVRVAIFGAGRMGGERARAVAALGATVCCVCDLDTRRASELAKGFPGCEVFAEPPSNLWDTISAAFVCTPPNTRGHLERLAINSRTPLLIEKPIGINATQIKDIVDLAEASGTLTAVGYMNRHRPHVRSLAEHLKTEQVLGMCANWVCGMYGVPWWQDEAQSGGPINEQATHLVDLSRYLLGEVSGVKAIRSNSTNAAVALEFESGSIASLFYSCGSTDKAIRLQVFTADETIHLSGWEFDRIGPDNLVDPPTRSREARSEIFKCEVREFLDAVVQRQPSCRLCSLQDAYQTQLLMDRIKLSFN